MTDLLLNAGASPALLDSTMGTSALHLAAQGLPALQSVIILIGGHVDCASLLLQKGAFLDLNNAFAVLCFLFRT